MKRLLLLLILITANQVLFSQAVFTSNASGDWTNPAIWTLGSGSDADGIPDADDDATISAAHVITINDNSQVKGLTFAASTSKVDFSVNDKQLIVFGNLVGQNSTDDYVNAGSGLNASGSGLGFSGSAEQVITNIGGTTNWPNLNINKSAGKVTSSGNLQIDGNLALTSGTLDVNGQALSMLSTSNISVAVGCSLINVGRVAQTTGGTAKNNSIEINGYFSSSTGSASINTINLTINSGAELNMQGTATGFSNTSGSENPTSMTCNTNSTVRYSGTGQTGRFTNYHHLILSGGTTAGSAQKTISAVGTLTIAGDLTISNGARFLGGGNYIVSGTTTINDNGEIQWNGGTGSTFTFNGNLVINGNSGNGVIRFGGASTTTPTYTMNGDVIVSASTTTSAFRLDSGTAGSENRTFQGNLVFNGNVTAASGATTLTSTSSADPASTNIFFGGTDKSLILSTGTSLINLRGDITFNTSRTISAPGGGGFTFTNRPSSVTPEWTVKVDNGATVTVNAGTYINLPNRSFADGTGAGNLTVNGDIRFGLAGGWNSLIALTGTVTLGPSSTVTFNGSVAQVTGTLMPTVNNLVLSNTAGVTVTNSFTCNGTVTVNQGSFVEGSDIIYGPNSTLLFNNSTGTYGIPSNSKLWPFNNGPKNVTVQGAGGVTLNAWRTVEGLCRTAAALTISTDQKLIINGQLQINAGGSISNRSPEYGPASTLIYNSGASNYGTSLEWPNTNSPFNVTVQNAGGITLNGWRTVQGLCQTSSGITIANNEKLTINGQLRINSGGFISNLSPEYGPASTLIYNSGAGGFNSSLEWPSSNAPFNVQILNSTPVTMTGSRSVNGTVTLTSGTLITGANTLTLGASGTISGESAGNYVIGNLSTVRTVGTGSSTFGDIGVGVNAGADDLGDVTVTRVSGDNGIVTFEGKSGIKRKWSVSSVNPPTAGRSLTLTWVSSDDNGKDMTTARVWKNTAGSWNPVGDAVDVSALNPRSITVNTNSFSDWTVSDATNALPVQLAAFSAQQNGTSIVLNWNTATEVSSHAFEIEQKSVSTEWVSVSSIQAHGNSNSPKQYSYTVKALPAGSYQFRLKMIDTDGTFEYSQPISVEISVPKEFALHQNYPNPFNPTTTLNYALPFQGNVQLLVYSINGELVKTLVSEVQAAGNYSVTFDASQLASGTYIYRLIATDATGKNFTDTKKMLLMK